MSNWVTKILKSPKHKKASQFVNKEATSAVDAAKAKINDIAAKAKTQAPEIVDKVNAKKNEVMENIQGKLPNSVTKAIPGLQMLPKDGSLPSSSGASTSPTRPEASIPFLSEQDILQYSGNANREDNAIIAPTKYTAASSNLLNLVEDGENVDDDLSVEAANLGSNNLTSYNQTPGASKSSPNAHPIYATIIPRKSLPSEAPRNPIPSPRSSSLVPAEISSLNDDLSEELSPEKRVTFSDISIEDVDESEATESNGSTTSDSIVLPTTQVLHDADTNTINITISRSSGSVSGNGTTLEEAIQNLKAISVFAESL